jgi:membrane protease YdiL (CAAX protease family)
MASSPPPLSDRPELPDGVDRPPLPPRAVVRTGMGGVPVWAPLAVFFGGLVPATVAFLVFAGGDVESRSATVISAIVQNAFWVGIAFLIVQGSTGRVGAASALGLRPTRLWPAVGWAAVAYFAFWIAAGVINVALGEPDSDQGLVEDLRDEDSLVMLVSYAVVACVAAPLGEEVLFRGVFFGGMRERLPYGVAAVIAGLVFGLIHLDAPIQGILLLCVFGISLCLLYQVTGSLLPCLALHALHNSITFSYTKGLPWWGYIGVIAASCLVVLAAGLAASRYRPATA